MKKETSWARVAQMLEEEYHVEWDTMLDTEIKAILEKGPCKAHLGIGYADCTADFSPQGIRLDYSQTVVTLSKAVPMMRIALREARILAARPDSTPAQLKDIERRIRMHMQGAYNNLLEVGHDLIAAKASGEIPHGEWEEWVRKNTGFSERQAQKLMQCAREVRPGSALAELPISTMQQILALPEAEREPMARRAKDESLTVKQLREEIRKLKGQYEELSGINTRTAQRAASADHQKIVAQQLLENEQNQREQERKSYEMRIRSLEEELQEAKENGEIPKEALDMIEGLKLELQEAEAYAREQARLRQEAQTELINAQVGGGPAIRDNDVTVMDYANGITCFLSTCGAMPGMDVDIARLPDIQRRQLERMVASVEDWTHGMRKAMALTMVDMG